MTIASAALGFEAKARAHAEVIAAALEEALHGQTGPSGGPHHPRATPGLARPEAVDAVLGGPLALLDLAR